VYANMNCSQ